MIAAAGAVPFSRAAAGALVRSVTPPDTKFQSARFAGPLQIRIRGLTLKQSAATVTAASSLVRLGARFPGPIVIKGDFQGIAIQPSFSNFQPVLFEKGALVLARAGPNTSLRFTGWRSPSIELEGEALLDPEGELKKLELRGRADPAVFQSYIQDEYKIVGDSAAWPPFLVRYTGSSVEIRLNDKTVFRSTWTLRKS